MAFPLLDTRGQSWQRGSSRFSPPAGETAGSGPTVGKEATIHLSPVFSNYSESRTVGALNLSLANS